MDYTKWANQYSNEAKQVKDYIKKIRLELKAAKSKKQATEIYYKISAFYQIYYELQDTARKIFKYAEVDKIH